MMGAFNINLYYGSETCEAADEYGRGCKHGLLFPVLTETVRTTNSSEKNKNLIFSYNKVPFDALLV